jgi:hypothetical protein
MKRPNFGFGMLLGASLVALVLLTVVVILAFAGVDSSFLGFPVVVR